MSARLRFPKPSGRQRRRAARLARQRRREAAAERERLEAFIEAAIDRLNELDGDSDLEDSDEGEDTREDFEDSHDREGIDDDSEPDHADYEPSHCGVVSGQWFGTESPKPLLSSLPDFGAEKPAAMLPMPPEGFVAIQVLRG